MKVSSCLLAVLSSISVATALDLGHAPAEQFAFQLQDSSDLPLEKQNINFRVPAVLSSLAQQLGQRIDDIPNAAIQTWLTISEQAPHLLGKIAKEMHRALNPQSSVRSRIPFLSEQWDYEVKNDAKFPNHGIRIKSPEGLGLDSVKQYSGYLDIEEDEKHLFFWFFESRNDPKNDPLILWLNGGPGCSSLLGLLFENGPATVSEDMEPIFNPYSWNSNASIFFLEQPVNTGYSYSEHSVSDTVTAGKDVYAFLSLFFEQFPEYANLDFHIVGESYGGHYVPVFASEIMSHHDRNFNISSVAIGNGLTDALSQYDYFQPMACGLGDAPAVLDEETCDKMLESQQSCDELIKVCYEFKNVWACIPAYVYCNYEQIAPYEQSGRNMYDVRVDCEGNDLCYPQIDTLDAYLNLDYVKEAIGAEVETHAFCNSDITTSFAFHGDWMKPYHTRVAQLLELGIPALIYAGDKDFICNWLGTEAWTRNLLWHGQDKFATQPLDVWTVDGTPAGEYRNFEHFTFLRVYEAGHMVPYDQPKNSLDMINRWISGDRRFN